MTDIEPYEDPIIRLIRDPNLNKDRAKTSKLIKIINGFPLAERKVSKLCSASFTILQTLEKMNLTFKSWEFLSLDYNSESHFDNKDDKLKSFNNNVADNVINVCNELNKKLSRISIDIDSITKSSRTLTPFEYISDSGTLLTSLLLRNIKLKTDVVDRLTVAYSKARLILIGKDLESMLADADDQDVTILTYKNFIINLLKQLNNAVEMEDAEAKYECLAVMNDMEKMFDAFKLEKIKEVTVRNQRDEEVESEEEYVDLGGQYNKSKPIPTPQPNKHRQVSANKSHSQTHTPRRPSPSHVTPKSSQNISDDEDYDYSDSDVGSNSLYSSTLSQPPMIHSITKASEDHSPRITRRDSMTSLSTSTLLHKTTISDEMPYLMTAFSSAKNIEEDISHFKEEEEKGITKKKVPEKERARPPPEIQHEKRGKQVYTHKSKLPENSLYSESVLLTQPPSTSPASSYLFSNASLLTKLGIKPQVITSDISNGKELSISGKLNHPPQAKLAAGPKRQLLTNSDDEEGNKENKKLLTPLTKANLESHNYSKLSPETSFADFVD